MGKQPKILILESEPGHGTMLAAELVRQEIEFACVAVERHDSVLSALDEEPTDLILAECTEPVESLFAALEAVRVQHPEIPFVIITSSCDPGLLCEIYECGAAGFARRQCPDELAPSIALALESAQHAVTDDEMEIIREQPVSEHPSDEWSVDLHPQVHPLCPHCHRIFDKPGQWDQLEVYLRNHHPTTVVLGTCPKCAAEARDLNQAPQAPLPVPLRFQLRPARSARP